MQALFIYITFNSITSIIAILKKPAYSHKDYGSIHLSRNSYYIQQRSMHRSRDTIVKTSFHLLERSTTLSSISKTDKKVFLHALLEYSFNPNEGVLQHKSSLLHQIFRDKYSSNIFKEHYLKRYPSTKVEFAKDIFTDFRIFGELPVIRKYEETFSADIKLVFFTGDSIRTIFEKQKQTNPDIIVDISSPFGLKRVYQDVKSVVKHSTRGSLDIVTLDSNKEIIPTTSQSSNFLAINKRKLLDIENGLKHDSLFETFKGTLGDGFSILNSSSECLINMS